MGFKIEPDLNTEKSRKTLAGMEAARRPGTLSGSKEPVRRGTQSHTGDGRGGFDRHQSCDRHDQLQRHQRQGGNLRRDDDQRPGLEDSRARWRFTHFGAGLYVDGSVGAAGSTGRGEANLYGLCSFLIVESLRLGMHPKDAAIEACKRIRTNTVEKRLLDRRGNPNFDVTFYVLDAKGRHAGVSLLSGASTPFAPRTGRKHAFAKHSSSANPLDSQSCSLACTMLKDRPLSRPIELRLGSIEHALKVLADQLGRRDDQVNEVFQPIDLSKRTHSESAVAVEELPGRPSRNICGKGQLITKAERRKVAPQRPWRWTAFIRRLCLDGLDESR